MVTSVRSFLTQKWNYLLGSAFLLASGAVQAQGPVTGYTLLNTTSCAATGHYYYISNNVVSGLNIAATVNDFRTQTGLGANLAYAAAIATPEENACITQALQAYNLGKYGSQNVAGPSPTDAFGFPWGDPHNAWIGYTDASVEGQFVWSNGQPNCNNFENWNYGEPNNYSGTVSNGEDYTEILIMNSYSYVQNPNVPGGPHNPPTGTMVDPLGRWNDWFNSNVIYLGQDKGATALPLVIEVGPQECQPPTRGTQGCTIGYWKNAKDAAWGSYAAIRDVAGSFVNTFNITVFTANVRGVLANLSLQDALELQAGGYNQVAKQGTAAFLNASRGFYPYTVDEVRTAVKQMFNNGSATLPIITVKGKTYGGTFNDPVSFAAELDALNNLGCPLNNKGIMTSSTSREGLPSVGLMDNAFTVSGYPNPSRSSFNIQVSGLSTENVSIKVTDMTGRLIEQRTSVPANQTIQIGTNYRAGMYYIEVSQGAAKQQLKMVKQ